MEHQRKILQTCSEAVNSKDPGSKTRNTDIFQTPRLDTVFNDTSLVSSSKPDRKKREIKLGQLKLKLSKVLRSHLLVDILILDEYLRSMMRN